MSPETMAAHREKAAWTRFTETRSSEDLATWRKALQQLHDELQDRTRILLQGVRTSAPVVP